MPAPVEIVRLRQAIEAFKARQPRNLPDGVMQQLEAVEKELSRVEPETDSPGKRAAEEMATGAPLKHAAKGPDQPSPGQRAARGLSAEIADAAAQIAEKVRGEPARTD